MVRESQRGGNSILSPSHAALILPEALESRNVEAAEGVLGESGRCLGLGRIVYRLDS